MAVREQVKRLSVVVAALAAVVLLMRFVVIPRAYFSPPLHRAATVRREVAKPIHFAGMAACRECHSDIYDKKAASYHRNLGCETCHGPSQNHAEDPMAVKPYAPRDRKFCPVCHAYNASRPTGFPQILPASHNPGLPCITCHNPHDPTPPEVPQECSACHRQIWRTKAVSKHADLACTTCHEVSEQHRITPRSALPTKPQAREFCGQCHASDAANPVTKKIDMTTHGGHFLCWQCHYPHQPEGNP
jgi:hypothetical protein